MIKLQSATRFQLIITIDYDYRTRATLTHIFAINGILSNAFQIHKFRLECFTLISQRSLVCRAVSTKAHAMPYILFKFLKLPRRGHNKKLNLFFLSPKHQSCYGYSVNTTLFSSFSAVIFYGDCKSSSSTRFLQRGRKSLDSLCNSFY